MDIRLALAYPVGHKFYSRRLVPKQNPDVGCPKLVWANDIREEHCLGVLGKKSSYP